MKKTNTALRTILPIAGALAVLVIGWFFVRDTAWWADVTESAEAAETLPSDLTNVLSTATVTRANVADGGELTGAFRYQDRVEFVHRVDPIEVTVTEQVGGGRNAQTITTVIEEPNERAITGLPAPGQIIAPGEVLYETDSTPVYAVDGVIAAWRTMKDGVHGPDVAQLHTFLVDNGWADSSLIGNEWLPATTTAVQAWQENTGQIVTGTVELGDIWFISGPIRIAEVVATEGLIVTDEEPLFVYTSQQRAIEATVDVLPEGLLDATDIEAQLPNGSVVPAQLVSVRGNEAGFDLSFDVDLTGQDIASVNGVRTTLTWTVDEIIDALTLPPEALRRTDAAVYVVDVLEGDVIRTVEVNVVGQAGRVVAIEGVDERAEVLVP